MGQKQLAEKTSVHSTSRFWTSLILSHRWGIFLHTPGYLCHRQTLLKFNRRDVLHILFMWKTNGFGPRTDPWGTPKTMPKHDDSQFHKVFPVFLNKFWFCPGLQRAVCLCQWNHLICCFLGFLRILGRRNGSVDRKVLFISKTFLFGLTWLFSYCCKRGQSETTDWKYSSKLLMSVITVLVHLASFWSEDIFLYFLPVSIHNFHSIVNEFSSESVFSVFIQTLCNPLVIFNL